ncbi:MAG: septum formation initiator family protein [bacterium]|nr:septum formation initiator family protein [bacterium]
MQVFVKRYIRWALLIVALIIIISMGRNALGLFGRKDQIKEARERVRELEGEQAQILELKEKVESPEFIEREAREKLGLAKSGEVVVVLPSEDILRRLAPKIEEEEFVEALPIWKRWAMMFF